MGHLKYQNGCGFHSAAVKGETWHNRALHGETAQDGIFTNEYVYGHPQKPKECTGSPKAGVAGAVS